MVVKEIFANGIIFEEVDRNWVKRRLAALGRGVDELGAPIENVEWMCEFGLRMLVNCPEKVGRDVVHQVPADCLPRLGNLAG